MPGAARFIPAPKGVPIFRREIFLGEIGPSDEVAAVIGWEVKTIGFVVLVTVTPQQLGMLYSRRFFSSMRSTSGGAAVYDFIAS